MNTLQSFFTTILNMSITATYVMTGVVFIRLLLRKAPKIFSYILWTMVLIRLLCPISFSSFLSIFGLLNINYQNNTGMVEYVPKDIGSMQTPAIQSGIGSLDHVVNTYLSQVEPIANRSPMQIWLNILSLVWLVGMLILLSYCIVSYGKMKNKLKTATFVKDNIYESDRISTAFVCGFIHPKIYLPLNTSAADISCMLEHERTHIRRKDNLIKPLAFLALILHWFNPLMWLAFILMSKDMEMSCDESVLRKLGECAKNDYSCSLLSLSLKRNNLLSTNPLGFGENHIKARIKNVLNYKKPVFWVIIASFVLVSCVGIVLMANPNNREWDSSLIPSDSQYVQCRLNVEDNLAIIISSPKNPSNPQDCIFAHQDEYQNIIRIGDDALQYLLSKFECGYDTEGLKGQIMMQLCKDLLGPANNVTDEFLSPDEWFATLAIRQEIKLSNFVYDGTNPIEKLVYNTEAEKNGQSEIGFTVIAAKIFNTYEEDDQLKVFLSIYSETYKLYENVLYKIGGYIGPAAITYKKDDYGNYILSKYESTKDGSLFSPSVHEFCTMPSSGNEIPGLANKMIGHYNDKDISNLLQDNLYEHLKKIGITDAVYKNPNGIVEFSMKNLSSNNKIQ